MACVLKAKKGVTSAKKNLDLQKQCANKTCPLEAFFHAHLQDTLKRGGIHQNHLLTAVEMLLVQGHGPRKAFSSYSATIL